MKIEDVLGALIWALVIFLTITIIFSTDTNGKLSDKHDPREIIADPIYSETLNGYDAIEIKLIDLEDPDNCDRVTILINRNDTMLLMLYGSNLTSLGVKSKISPRSSYKDQEGSQN